MPFNKTEALRRAEEHVSKGEITGAIAIHRMIAQADPYDLNTINALGELYVTSGRTQEAIADFTRIADGYLSSGSGIKAAYLLRKALDLDPSNATALMKLGEVYLREGMIEKAHDEFIRAGALLMREGQITGALQANHRALTAKPGSPQARAAIAALQADAAASETGSLPRLSIPESTESRNLTPLASKQERRTQSPAQGSSNAEEESLIKQLSKAEMLVGYGQVDQGIALLKDVVSHSPDNLDVHGKLKDVYLRNEMIREAAQECLELARIHEARGESGRAGEYTMRAGRLAQSSGQLSADPAAATLEPQTAAPPAKQSESKSESPALKIESEHSKAEQQVRRVASPSPAESGDPIKALREADPQPPSPAVSRPLASPTPIQQEIDPQPAEVAPNSSQPIVSSAPSRREVAALPIALAPRPSVLYSRPVAERAPMSLGLHVGQTPLVTAPLSNSKPAPSRPQIGSSSFAVASTLGLTRVASTPVSRNRSKWLYAGPMILVCAIALTLGATKGASMYGARLDGKYEELALASSTTGKPSLPGLPSAEDLQPRAETEAVKIDSPPTQTVTPSGSAAEQETATYQPPAAEPEPKTRPEVISEPVRVKLPAAPPPMIAITDQKGGENMAPRGLPIDAPQSVAPAPSPPPAVPAPQRVSAVIKGEAVKQVQPNYPEIARTARQEGAVPVEVSINEKGDVVSARAMSGPVLLRGAAESAAMKWKFRPSTRDGKALATVTTINFRFKL